MASKDSRWLEACAALAARGRPLSRPNPAVGAIVVKDGAVIARGWTQAGGRPHAEAMTLDLAGAAAEGATLYVSLEPCAHESARGPACADLVAASGIARVVVGMTDPDPRTSGKGIERLRAAGKQVDLADCPACIAGLEGFASQTCRGRPHVTLKLATSLDGFIAMADGSSQWITGEAARAHCHAQRARADAICVGGGTLRADQPQLTVRLSGLDDRSPARMVLTRGHVPEGWQALPSPEAIHDLPDVQYFYLEGGASAAAAFLRVDLVDRIHLYRAPIVVGGGIPCLGDIGLASLSAAHGRWASSGQLRLGTDTLDVYDRIRN